MAEASATAPLQEIGHVTGSQWWSDLENEVTPEVRWPLSIEVYSRMRHDAQVTSVLSAVTKPVRRTVWRLDPQDAREEVTQKLSEDLGLQVVGGVRVKAQRTRDRFSWSEHVRLALLMLPFGHQFFEQVYRLDQDGYARLRKLAQRPCRTIQDIDVARDGGLVSIQQWGVDRPIPVSRLVAYVNEMEDGNWRGQSLLRSCYKNWLLKDRLLRVGSTTVERNGLGIPKYKAGKKDESLDAGLAMATKVRAGDNSGIAVPEGSDMELMGVTGTLPDALPQIRYHDEQIGRAVLAHFLNLGTQTGSWALGSTFADFFTLSLQAVAQSIADVATMHIVEDWVDINYGPDEPAPRIVFDEIGSRHPATAEAIKTLIEAGALTPDDSVEELLRNSYGLPPKSSSSPRARANNTVPATDPGATNAA